MLCVDFAIVLTPSASAAVKRDVWLQAKDGGARFQLQTPGEVANLALQHVDFNMFVPGPRDDLEPYVTSRMPFSCDYCVLICI